MIHVTASRAILPYLLFHILARLRIVRQCWEPCVDSLSPVLMSLPTGTVNKERFWIVFVCCINLYILGATFNVSNLASHII